MRFKSFFVLVSSALLLSASLFLAPAAFAGNHPDNPGEGGGVGDKVLTGPQECAAAAETTDDYDELAFLVKYEIPEGNETDPSKWTVEGDDVVTFTNPQTNDDGELTGFDWSSTTDIAAIVLKAGDAPNQYLTFNPPKGSGSVASTADHGISHITFCTGTPLPPPPSVSADASIGDVECGETSTTVTLTSDGESSFTVKVEGNEVTGSPFSAGEYDIELGEEAGEYTVTVESDDLDGTVSKDLEVETDCADEAAAISGNCDDGATVTLSGDPGSVFEVTVGTDTTNITLDSTGSATETFALPADAVTEVSVAGAATAVDTFDCTTDVEGVVEEKEPPAEEPAPEPEEEEEVEVKPNVIEREELAFTGSTEEKLLVIALAMLGLGLPLTLVKPKWQRINAR